MECRIVCKSYVMARGELLWGSIDDRHRVACRVGTAKRVIPVKSRFGLMKLNLNHIQTTGKTSTADTSDSTRAWLATFLIHRIGACLLFLAHLLAWIWA